MGDGGQGIGMDGGGDWKGKEGGRQALPLVRKTAHLLTACEGVCYLPHCMRGGSRGDTRRMISPVR